MPRQEQKNNEISNSSTSSPVQPQPSVDDDVDDDFVILPAEKPNKKRRGIFYNKKC